MRLTWFGPNIGYPPVPFDPAEIGRAGFNALAVNLTDHATLPDFVRACQAVGLAVCGRVVSGSLDRFPDAEAAARYYRTLGLNVLTVGNETDGQAGVHTDGSWLQTKAEWEAMRQAFVLTFAGSGVPLYGIGTVTGQPDALNELSLAGLAGLDNHLYTAEPPTVWNMLGNYDRFDSQYGLKTRMCSEFGWPGEPASARGQYVVGLVRAVEAGNDRRVALGQSPLVGMFPYCWDRVQHAQPFFLNDPAAIRELRKLGYGPSSVPAPPAPPPVQIPPPIVPPVSAPQFRLGFARMAQLAPDVIGEPLEDERGAWVGQSAQRTTTGILFYADRIASFIGNDGRRFYWYDGLSEVKEVAA